MSNRAQRRAAERLANRMSATAATAAPTTATATPPAPVAVPPETATAAATTTTTPNPTISDAQLAANRANSKLSSGPTTPLGKATSSLNAVKTGLTGRTILLPTDDVAAYQQLIHLHIAEFAPVTDREKALVQTIADTEWRLLRIAPLESGIYAIGRIELAHLHPEERNPLNRQALIQTEIFRTYRKELNNLALQERRLRNQRKADIAELQAMQQERIEKAEAEAKQNPAAVQPTVTASAANGFVFSTAETTPSQLASNNTSTAADANESLFNEQEQEKTQAA